MSCYGDSSDQLIAVPISTNVCIPQGIKSPNTCAGLYLICGPCTWWKSLSWSLLLPWASLRAARLSCEEQFNGCNLKLVQLYRLYFCCCSGLAREWCFIGHFRYEMWNTGELYSLWSPGGRAQGTTVHGAWQIVGGSEFSLRLRDIPVGSFGGWRAWEKWGPCAYTLPALLWGRASLWGATPGSGLFLWCGKDRSVPVPCTSTTDILTLTVWPWGDDLGVCCEVEKSLWTVLFCFFWWWITTSRKDLVELFSLFVAKFYYLLHQLWLRFFQTSAFTVCH